MCATRQEKRVLGLTVTQLNRTKKRFDKIFGPNIVLLIGPLGNNEKTPETLN